MMADKAQVVFVICGKEEIAADGLQHTLNAGKMGTNIYKKVPSQQFNSWFKLTNSGKDQSTACNIATYKLFKGGVEITPTTKDPLAQLTKDYNRFIKQDLLIDLRKDTTSGEEFEIEAITIGKKSVKQKLTINVNTKVADTDTGCRFTVAPLQGESVLPYLTAEQLGAENVKRRLAGKDSQVSNSQVGRIDRKFFEVFTVGTSDPSACQVKDDSFTGNIWHKVMFAKYVGVEKGKKGASDLYLNKFVPVNQQTDLISDLAGPSTSQILFKVTTKDEFAKACPDGVSKPCNLQDPAVRKYYSNVVQNDITVCGNEKVAVKDPAPFK